MREEGKECEGREREGVREETRERERNRKVKTMKEGL